MNFGMLVTEWEYEGLVIGNELTKYFLIIKAHCLPSWSEFLNIRFPINPRNTYIEIITNYDLYP